MRTILFPALLLTALIFSQSCTRSADDTNPGQVGTSNQNVTTGTWRVSLFSERGDDETGDFAGYRFEFNSGGVLKATRNGVTNTGTWSTNSSSTRFFIDLGPKTDSNKPLGELTDDWVVISISANEIKLKDDNVSSDEFLTFTRN